MTADPQAVVAGVLRRLLPDAAEHGISWRPLAGGLNVRSFLVRSAERSWVLRLPLPGAPALVDLETEARIMRAAADAGIAPAVVAVDTASEALLTDFEAGAAAWDARAVRAPRNIERAAAMLKTLHGIRVDAPSYGAAEIAARYAALLGGAAKPSVPPSNGAIEAAWAEELAVLAARYDARHAPEALCHNDLAAANVLDDGRGLKLVDFEYAVRSAPILDLAGLIAMNDFSPSESRRLAEAYYGAAAEALMSELASVARMIRLMSFFWARIGEHTARDAAPYAELAAALAERLRAGG